MAIIFGSGATGSRWYFGRIQNWWWRIRIRMRHITVTWGTIADLVCIIGSINRHRYRWPRWRLCGGIMFTSASDITPSSRRITTCHSWWGRRLDWRPPHHRHDTLCMFTYSTEASNISCKKNRRIIKCREMLKLQIVLEKPQSFIYIWYLQRKWQKLYLCKTFVH